MSELSETLIERMYEQVQAGKNTGKKGKGKGATNKGNTFRQAQKKYGKWEPSHSKPAWQREKEREQEAERKR